MTAKEDYVYRVFQRVADGYDLANMRISLGAHLRWKKAAAEMLCDRLPPNPAILDIGCGTGDMLRIFSSLRRDAVLTGIDFSPNMLKLAKENCRDINDLRLLQGNALSLPLEDESVDGVSLSFALRNMADYEEALREAARVLKPGGSLMVIDSFVPQNRLIKPFYQVYFSGIMPVLGGGIQKQKEYRWLARSTAQFIAVDELCELLWQADLCYVQEKHFLFGACACVVFTTPNAVSQ